MNCHTKNRFLDNPCTSRKWRAENDEILLTLREKDWCSREKNRKKTEAVRRQIIHKLKSQYKIKVEELNNDIIDDMVSKVKIMQRQKKIREKEKIQRRINVVTKLIQESKQKRWSINPVKRKKLRKKVLPVPPIPISFPEVHQEEEYDENVGKHDLSYSESLEIAPIDSCWRGEDQKYFSDELRSKTVVAKEEEPASNEWRQQKSYWSSHFFEQTQKQAKAFKRELNLKCSPSSITFENKEPHRTYTQSYRITNIGQEVIHCRYVGIKAKNLPKDAALPFRVEPPDNVLLRPGLSFTSKVRMFCYNALSEMRYFLVYETRRKASPKNYAYFKVPVEFVSARAIVEVVPTVVRFPSIPWCNATGPKCSKYLIRTIRIMNMGSKECSCTISNLQNPESTSEVEKPIEGEIAETSNEEFYEYWCQSPESDQEVEAIVAELLNNVFAVFRFNPKYAIFIPAMSTVKVDVAFIPEYQGYHHKVAFIRFDGAFNKAEEKIELLGDVEKIPLRVEPSIVDLKICTINSGVYQATFNIYNDGNNSLPLRLKVPGSMKNHALVFPRTPIVQPKNFQTCSVKLFPGITISRDAFRYYKENTGILEFPVFIDPGGSKQCKSHRVKLYIFAILTDYSLELTPKFIDFSVVTTLETVRTGIKLTNHSKAPQKFGFLNLPMGVRIEPGFGFGTIPPKETIDLKILYSPIVEPGLQNALQQEGRHDFQICVTSVAEKGSFGKQTRYPSSELVVDNRISQKEDFRCSTGTEEQSVENENLIEDDEDDVCREEGSYDTEDNLKILEDKRNRIREYLNREKEEEEMDANVIAEDGTGSIIDSYRNYFFDTTRNDMNTIQCSAVIVRPSCWLSATVIELPATPLSSFSLTKFRLNAIKCESFEAVFEFQPSSSMVTIEPRSGYIQQNQSIPITVIFRPEFSKQELRQQLQNLNFDITTKEEETPEELSQKKTKSKTARMGQQSMFTGERMLQQFIDPFKIVIKVDCNVKAVGAPVEHHRLIINAPVIRPSFIYMGSSQEIKFGKVAVGNRSRKLIEIKNISLKRIAPRITALNPRGPFTCTTGWRMDKVDPEHIWRQPITFAPFQERGQENEFFEVKYGATSIALTVNGEGVFPKLAFTPNFAACILENTSEIEFAVENLCQAELRLQFNTSFIGQKSNDLEESLMSLKRKTAKNGKQRGSFISELSEIKPELDTFEAITEPSQELFAFLGLNADNEAVVQSSEKITLKIRFTPRNLIRKGGNGVQTINSAYVVKYDVFLFGNTKLRELYVIGRISLDK